MSRRPSRHVLNTQEVCAWRSQTMMAAEEELAAEDEPPDQLTPQASHTTSFSRATVQQKDRPQESLLTKALNTNPEDTFPPEIHIHTNRPRRRSILSVTSAASTADLTSDGMTSPTRTNTPSPPLPTACAGLVPASLGMKPLHAHHLTSDPSSDGSIPTRVFEQAKIEPMAPAAAPKKRCITFACAQKPMANAVPPKPTELAPTSAPAKRACTIKFACAGRPVERQAQAATLAAPAREKPVRPRSPAPSTMSMRASNARGAASDSTVSETKVVSPVAHPASRRPGRPKFLSATEDELESEATRFNEFASGELLDDDWVRRDDSALKSKLTINDTLQKENVFRRLGQEVEDEADDADEFGDDSDDELDEDDDDDDDDEDNDEDELDDYDVHSFNGSLDESDGNLTDNEAGFAESDDESDGHGDYQFWTTVPAPRDVSVIRASERRASVSSIDSLKHMSPVRRRGRAQSQAIKIRPGTPDLPDSTDFVCGTLDEDRPLEAAYISCMEARKRERQHTIPQDIDPSFPTSDPENEDDEVIVLSSDDHMLMHGNLDDMDDSHGPHRTSPKVSPKRLHSPPPNRLRSPPKQRLRSPPPKQRLRSPPPKQRLRSPPPKQRLRSPPPRRLFGGSPPPRARSPPPARAPKSPHASPTKPSAAIAFTALAHRPGPTFTKSLPRTTLFGAQHEVSRLSAIHDDDDSTAGEGHTRRAIDIVKGLEQKRQRRKEKFFQKHCNRARKGLAPERRAVPGQGCERMREVGLQMAGKIDLRTKKAEYVLSV